VGGDAKLTWNSISAYAAVTILLLGATAISAPAHAAENGASALQGVYTKDQAARGKTRYFTSCAACHGGVLQGDGDTPELAGKSFMKRWGDQSVGALFTFATSQMPIGRPGSLGAQGYADIIAFILANNGYPDGEKELPTNEPALEGIVMETKK
jgi:mono/diheme cytochrome c family protein